MVRHKHIAAYSFSNPIFFIRTGSSRTYVRRFPLEIDEKYLVPNNKYGFINISSKCRRGWVPQERQMLALDT